MRDYVVELERQLVMAAELEARRGDARVAKVIAGVSASARVRAAALAFAAAVAIAVVIAIAARPGPALAFPVLARPATDASGISIADQLRRNGAQLDNAREIQTPYGMGYAIPAADGGLCLAAPDPSGGYGQTCSSADDAAAGGVVLVLVPATGSNAAVAEFVAVLPSGTTTPIVEYADGTSERLALDDGVAATLVRANATIAYRVNGVARTAHVPARVPAPTVTGAVCTGSHGHYRRVGPRPGALPPNPCG